MSRETHGNFFGKHLVIFGCGYVGSEVARQARARSMVVTVLTRNETKAAALAAAGTEIVVADLADDSWHAKIDRPADFVLNSVSSGGGGIDGYRRSYVDGMKSILTWAGKHGRVGTMVYTSSTSVYPQSGGADVDELSAATPRDERAAILIEAEGLLRAAVASGWSARAAVRSGYILRLAGIYGPGRVNLVEQVRSGEVSGCAGNHVNLIHREDICSAIWAAFTASGTTGDRIFNVVDNAPATRAEIAIWLAIHLGVPVPRFNDRPVAGRRAPALDRRISNRRIKASLGWAPRYPSFREGYSSILAASSSVQS